MAKIVEQWFLFAYIDGQLTPLSKPFKNRALAEKARMQYPEKKRKTVGLGLIRVGQQGKDKP